MKTASNTGKPRRRLPGMLVLAGVLALAAASTAQAATLITGATVIDATGRAPIADGAVLIDHGRIVAVGPAATIRAPAGAERVDAHGKYVIPGLMDANVHLFYATMPEYLFKYEGHYEDIIQEAAEIALKHGLTTVFDTWGPREPLVHVRDRINAGQAVGTRIYLAGNIIGISGPTASDFFPLARTILSKTDADRIDQVWEQGVGGDLPYLTPEQVRARVHDYIADGHLDFIKYLSSGHQQEQLIAFSPDTQKAIVEEGHKAGLKVQAHSTSPESLKLEIQAGVDLLQHCDVTGPEPIPASTLKIIVDRHLPCAAMFVTQDYLAWGMQHLPNQLKVDDRTKDVNDRNLVAAGARLLLTTDGGVLPPNILTSPTMGPVVGGAPDLGVELGFGHLRWLKAAKFYGMSPMAALQAATINIAQAYGRDAEIGTLEAGKRADLLILDADPLADPANYGKLDAVYKDGVRIDIKALPTKRFMSIDEPQL